MSGEIKRRNAIFFLGAGASAHAGIMTVGPMTDAFVEHIRRTKHRLHGTLSEIVARLAKKTAPNVPDIEAILRTLHRLIDHRSDEISGFLAETHGISLKDLNDLKDELQKFIREKVLRPVTVDYLAPLLDPTWGTPVEIFSVNYDPCVELLCRAAQRRLIDGFTPEWNPLSLEANDEAAVYLYKLHGSVLWFKTDDGWPIKIPIGSLPKANGKLELYDGRRVEPIILSPMHKQPMEAPLLDFSYLFKERLEQANFLIVIGYSFRDGYLSALLRDAMSSNANLHVVIIGPDSRKRVLDLSKEPSFAKVFATRITCLPFPVENILKRFTSDFVGFSSAIKKQRDDRRLAQTGRDVRLFDNIEILSRYWEADLSNQLFDWMSVHRDLAIDTMWTVSLRNFALSIVMDDRQLMESTGQRVFDVARYLWQLVSVSVVYSNGWRVRLEMRIPNRNDTSYSTQDFWSLSRSTQAMVREISELLMMINRQQRNVRGVLENLREKLLAIQTFFEGLARSNASVAKELHSALLGQMPEKAVAFNEWYDDLRTTTVFESDKYDKAIDNIIHHTLPKCLQELCRYAEAAPSHVEALKGVVPIRPQPRKRIVRTVSKPA